MQKIACKIAKRFWTLGEQLSLDTKVLNMYPDLIDLSIGDTDFTTDEAIIKRAFADASLGHTHYGNPQGDPELIEAIQMMWREDFGQSLLQDEIMVSASSCLGMSLALMAILNPEDEVIVLSPYFSPYKDQIALAGGKMVEVPLAAENNFKLDRDLIESAISEKTKAIIFNNPCNPSGMAYDRTDIEMLAQLVEKHDLLLLADEIYTYYVFEGDFVLFRALKGMKNRTITLNSFSKNFMMTGWRLAYIVADPALIKVMNFINSSLIYTAPSISQRAGIEAVKRRQGMRAQYMDVYRKRMDYANQRLARIEYVDLVEAKGTFYLFPDVSKSGMDGASFTRHLLEHEHVLLSPGHLFGMNSGNHVRIACTKPIEVLEEAFDRMERLSF